MYKKGAGNDKQGKDTGNRTLCPYRNFSQAIIVVFSSPCGSQAEKDYHVVYYETRGVFIKFSPNVLLCFTVPLVDFERSQLTQSTGDFQVEKDYYPIT